MDLSDCIESQFRWISLIVESRCMSWISLVYGEPQLRGGVLRFCEAHFVILVFFVNI